MSWWREAWVVFAKEAVDALRDRRTLAVVLLSSVLMGPALLFALSNLVTRLDARAEQREVLMAGMERAPTLVNFLQRQTFTVREAPADYERQLREARLPDPVLVVPEDFEALLAKGEAPLVEVVVDSGNRRSEAGGARLQRLVAGFGQERTRLALALRGVAGEWLEPVRLAERDLADVRARGAQITGLLPFFVLMAMLYGALNAALDSTAGERERGALEPLLGTPASRSALVAGKWAAVVAVAMLIAVLSCLSFLPGQWLLRSETLSALFRFGPAEALRFVAALLPLACALAAVLMAVAIRSRTVKQAQASASVVLLLVSLMPLASLFELGAEAGWHLWVPALGQNVLMLRVLKGEPWGAEQVIVPLIVAAAITAVALGWVARSLRRAVLE